MSYLKSISWLKAVDNIAGILEIKVARKADIQSIPSPVNGVVFGDIVFKPGKGFTTWNATHETANADSQSRISREGTSRNNKLPFYIPKGRADITEMFDRAERDEFIVVYKEANGSEKIFGLLHAPVQFKYDHTTGADVTESNRYNCQFFYTGPNNIFQYNGAIAQAPPSGNGPAIVQWADGTPIAQLFPGDILIVDSDFDHDFELISA